MSQINYEPHRSGMTVLPDAVEEATGERIEGSSQVVDTRVANWAGQSDETYEETQDSIYEQEEAIAEDPDHPDSIQDAVVLADISDEIHQSTVSYNEELATAIATAPMSGSPADVTVQYLSNQVYLNNLSPEEAFNEAMSSGINPEQLAYSYQKLKALFPKD